MAAKDTTVTIGACCEDTCDIGPLVVSVSLVA
jgi:hypothetical protein